MDVAISKRLFLISLFFFVGLFYPAKCPADKIRVVASIFPVADIVQQVGGKYIDVTFIIPAGASPHTFDPKPSQIKQIASARIFFMIGAGMETWAEKFTASAGRNLVTIKLSQGVRLIGIEMLPHDDDDRYSARGLPQGETENPTGKPIAANPHIWLDPEIVKSMVKNIQSVLSGIDPTHGEYYQQRGRAFFKRLVELDHHIRSIVAGFTLKKFVAFHAAWEYFARRYGLEPVGIIESTPGRNPTPKKVKKIITDIKRYNIRAVFAEPQLNPKVAAVIAGEANVKVLLLDPMGGPAIKGRNTYLELMAYNLNVMKEAMQ